MAAIAGFGDVEVGPNLRPLVVTNEILARNVQFVRKDAEAVAEQKSLVRLLRWINIVVLVIAVLSGVVLAASLYKADLEPPWPDRVETSVKWIAGFIGLLSIVATVLGQLARDGDRLGRWRGLRSEAEAARCGRFTAIARAAAAAGAPAAREALELVRLGLLEDQRGWYAARAQSHRSGARLTSGFSVFALLLTATASGAALIVTFTGLTEALLLVGVLAAAFSAYAADRDNLYRDRANAALYERTAEKLGALSAGSDTVQAEIEAGNPQAIVVFTDLVADELQAEHRQWAVSLDVMGELLTRLEQRLQQARAMDARKKPASITDDGGFAATEPRSAGPGSSETSGTGVGQVETVIAPATGSAGMTRSEIAARLALWRPLLVAATTALPKPQADQAQLLLGELTTVLAPLDSDAPVSSAIAAAQELAVRLQSDNPLGQWFGTTAPKIAGILGTVLPPLTLVLGIAAVGARLGEDAYRRWVSEVLQTPFSPGLVKPADVTSTMMLAAFEVSPEFAGAWADERTAGNLAAITAMGELLLQDPEQLWAQQAARFAGDRARYDRGAQEMRGALLIQAVEADIAEIPPGELPEGTNSKAILDATRLINGSQEAEATLLITMQLLHELRNEGVTDPVAALRAALTGGKSP